MTEPKSLQDYLSASTIRLRSELSSSKKLVQEMAHLLATQLPVEPDEDIEKIVYHALLEREKLGNTGIGNGVALPHSRLGNTSEAVIAIITLAEAIDYDSPDRQPVDVAFGLIVPTEATREHLTILADIARIMSQDDNKQQLLSAQDPQQVIDLIASWSVANS